MARARGANARLYGEFESIYGTPPSGDFIRFPFVSSNLGAEQGLIESDLLGQGREGFDPVLDVINNDGDLVVPVDARGFGYWLMLYFGEPVTAAEAAATGSIVFSAQPAAESTITINGTAFTYKASGAAGNQIDIGANLGATMTATASVLNASVVSGVAEATYSTSGGTTLVVTHDTLGPGGNAFTLAAQAASNGTVSGATLTGGTNSHTFTSGEDELPSMSLEVANPEVPSFEMNYGIRGNTMRIEMSRRGLLNATLGLIGKGSSLATTTGAGTPTTFDVDRFAQATGEVTQDGDTLASVVSSSLAYSNNLDKVETIQPDGEIEDADPGMSTGSGNITVRLADNDLLDLATGRDPFELTQGWTFEDFSLTFNWERVLLPKPKRPITGPAGVQASFDWQGSGADGNVASVVLVNDVAAYTLP